MKRPHPHPSPGALLCVAALGLALGAAPVWAAGGGGPSGGAGGSLGASARGARKIAAKKYESALEYIAKAHAREQSLAEASPEERARLEKKARKDYEKALDKLESSLRRDPLRHEAHSDRGYVLRKLGDYETALTAYDEALALAPRYAPAIEYRAEAYLELERLADVQAAHTRLMRIDRPLADQLLEKMQAWVARYDPESDDSASPDLEAFRAWVGARTAAAQDPSSDSSRRW